MSVVNSLTYVNDKGETLIAPHDVEGDTVKVYLVEETVKVCDTHHYWIVANSAEEAIDEACDEEPDHEYVFDPMKEIEHEIVKVREFLLCDVGEAEKFLREVKS